MSASNAVAGAVAEPVLDVNDLQGDALAGFRKDHVRYSFLRITEPTAARASLAAMLDRISPLRDVATFADLFRSVRRRRGEVPGSLSATWTNIAFTARGLAQLSSPADVASFGDAAFRAGLAARSGLLGDPSDKKATGHQSNWRFGGETTPVDAVLIVASDDRADRDATADALTATLEGGGWSM